MSSSGDSDLLISGIIATGVSGTSGSSGKTLKFLSPDFSLFQPLFSGL